MIIAIRYILLSAILTERNWYPEKLCGHKSEAGLKIKNLRLWESYLNDTYEKVPNKYSLSDPWSYEVM